MKRCVDCGIEKPIENFFRRRTSSDGRADSCLDCGAGKRKTDHRVRAERMKVDPEYAARVRKYNREWKLRERERSYGLEEGEIERIFAKQHGRCIICNRTADEVAVRGTSGERLHMDHNHETGRFRGLICKKCNSILGLADDDPHRLMAAAAYLLRCDGQLQEIDLTTRIA